MEPLFSHFSNNPTIFSSFFSSNSRSTSHTNSISSWNFHTLLKNNDISLQVQQHLIKVYNTLFLTLLATIVGVLVESYLHLSGCVTLGLEFLILYYFTTIPHYQLQQRFLVLLAFGTINGINISSLLQYAIALDSSILCTALLSTMGIFLSFTLSALVMKRRSYFFLSSILSSGMLWLVIISFMNMFYRNVYLFNLHLYGGLFLFSGYILLDTQMIIEQASNGEKNYIGHALKLFTDFIDIFIRIIIILIRNANEKEKKRERKRN